MERWDHYSGLLLDVPKHRREPYVTYDEPVHGWELEDIAKEQGVTLEPGDALVVYSGREKWNEGDNLLWGSTDGGRVCTPHVLSLSGNQIAAWWCGI